MARSKDLPTDNELSASQQGVLGLNIVANLIVSRSFLFSRGLPGRNAQETSCCRHQTAYLKRWSSSCVTVRLCRPVTLDQHSEN